MHCEKAEMLLPLLVFDELEGAEKAELMSHLSGCAACSEKLGDLRVTMNLLREGIAAEEFELHWQPIVELANGRIVGAEALLRWRRDGELLTPDRFLPLADETMLIDWVRSRLAGFKVPRSIVVLDELPKGGTGKVQKQQLRTWDA